MRINNQKGFSLVELMIVVSIFAILAAIAIPALLKYQRDFKFLDYASQMEYLVKQGKIYAMERTVNVGVCVSGNTLAIRNLGTSRGAGICSGTAIMTMTVTDSYVTLAGSGASFDPRGLAIQIGNVCVIYPDRNMYEAIRISRAGIRTERGEDNRTETERGTGACPS